MDKFIEDLNDLEAGKLNTYQVVKLFKWLNDTKLIFRMHETYRNMAKKLIQEGYLMTDEDFEKINGVNYECIRGN